MVMGMVLHRWQVDLGAAQTGKHAGVDVLIQSCHLAQQLGQSLAATHHDTLQYNSSLAGENRGESLVLKLWIVRSSDEVWMDDIV